MADKIILYLHCDGYSVNGIFHCRELAYEIAGGPSGSVFFKMGEMPKSLHDKIGCYQVFQHIHGLPVVGQSGDFSQALWPLIVSDLYEQHKTKKRYLVAIKANPWLRKLLESLKIPHVNLKDCPGFLTLDETASCGRHVGSKRCARAIVKATRTWFESSQS